MKIILSIFLLCCVFVSNTGISNAETTLGIEGTWLTEEKDAKVKVYPCGEAYCGEIVWLASPNWTEEDVEEFEGAMLGMPKVDLFNDDKGLQTRPILGMQLLKGLKESAENEWEGGTIYDAKSGNTYSCKAELKDANTLKLRGYMGVSWLGRTTVWTR